MDLIDLMVAIDVQRQILDDLIDSMVDSSVSVSLESSMYSALDCIRSIKKMCEYKVVHETIGEFDN